MDMDGHGKPNLFSMDTLRYVCTYVIVPGMDKLTFYVGQFSRHTLLCPSDGHTKKDVGYALVVCAIVSPAKLHSYNELVRYLLSKPMDVLISSI